MSGKGQGEGMEMMDDAQKEHGEEQALNLGLNLTLGVERDGFCGVEW
jgi:hypothetical protein